MSLLSILALTLLAAPQQPTCTQTAVVFAEDFDQGVLPPGWVADDWILAQPPVCNAQCGSGFLATYWDAGCDCATTGAPGCKFGGDLVSPPIALPPLGPGQALVLDFCFDGYLDTFTGDCNQLEVRDSLGLQTFKLGENVVVPCPGPSFLPPFDLSAYAGRTIHLTFHAGSVDAEGVQRMTIDDVSIVLYDADPIVDCNANGLPDGCDLVMGVEADCNANLVPDSCDIASGASLDCNANGVPDLCDLAQGAAQDCNGNLVPDSCDIATGVSLDCDANGVPDLCDLAQGTAQDCNGNGVPDSCDIASGLVQDCNGNGVPDPCDIASGTSVDLDANGKPDECQCANTYLYCVSAPNSLGQEAKIGWSGSTSILTNDLVLEVSDAIPNQLGIFILGTAELQVPYGDGFLCVTGSVKRILPPVLLDVSGAGAYAVDFGDPSSPFSALFKHQERNVQFWYRDPLSTGAKFNFSDAAHLQFCP